MSSKEFHNEMRRRQFVDDAQGYTRAFTFIKEDKMKLYIGHRIEGKIGKLTNFEYEDLDLFINHFDKI